MAVFDEWCKTIFRLNSHFESSVSGFGLSFMVRSGWLLCRLDQMLITQDRGRHLANDIKLLWLFFLDITYYLPREIFLFCL